MYFEEKLNEKGFHILLNLVTPCDIVSFQDSISWVNICSMALFEKLLFQHKCPLLGEKYSWSLLSDREFEGCLPHLTILFLWFAARPPPLDLRGLSTIREGPTHMALIRTMTEPGWVRNFTLFILNSQLSFCPNSKMKKKLDLFVCVCLCCTQKFTARKTGN
jgi:hypothetical protein